MRTKTAKDGQKKCTYIPSKMEEEVLRNLIAFTYEEEIYVALKEGVNYTNYMCSRGDWEWGTGRTGHILMIENGCVCSAYRANDMCDCKDIDVKGPLSRYRRVRVPEWVQWKYGWRKDKKWREEEGQEKQETIARLQREGYTIAPPDKVSDAD